MKIYTSFVTIPPRYNQLAATLDSLLKQSEPPEKIFIYVPRTFVLFPVPDFHAKALKTLLQPYGEKVDLRQGGEDFGPNNKLIAAALIWEKLNDENAWMMICDDDISYHPEVLAGYRRALQEKPESLHTYYATHDRFLIPGTPIPHLQGADSYLIPPAFFKKCSAPEIARYLKYCLNLCPEAFFQDDYLNAMLFHLKGMALNQLPALQLQTVQFIDQLHKNPKLDERENRTLDFLRKEYERLKALFGAAG